MRTWTRPEFPQPYAERSCARCEYCRYDPYNPAKLGACNNPKSKDSVVRISGGEKCQEFRPRIVA